MKADAGSTANIDPTKINVKATRIYAVVSFRIFFSFSFLGSISWGRTALKGLWKKVPQLVGVFNAKGFARESCCSRNQCA
jgi:hypothetical protein